jgi:CheY-like chemotaxis protein
MAAENQAAKTVLVVEDNAIASAGLAAVLRHHGYRAAVAPNGNIAQYPLAGPPPDLILLDMLMPEMDGWRFLDWLAGTACRDVPVVVTTGTNLTAEWAAAHGCAGFLKKPLDVGDLLATVGRVIGPPPPAEAARAAPPPARVLVVDDNRATATTLAD